MEARHLIGLVLCSAMLASLDATTHKKEGDPCNLTSGETGECRRLKACPSATKQKSEVCGFLGDQKMVCCAQEVPGPLGKKRISDRACEKYSKSAPLFGMEFPHMAALKFNDSSERRCGGSLISDQFVLTAAHCVSHPTLKPPRLVRLGVLDIESPSKDDFVLEPTAFYVHPSYSRSNLYGDVALIKLPSKVDFSQYIHPACLYTKPDTPEKMTIVGWGATAVDGTDTSRFLKKAVVPSAAKDECLEGLSPSDISKLPKGFTEDLVCTNDEKAHAGTCGGDSGGPLEIQDGANRNVHAVVGVIMYSTKPCGHRSLYTRVYSYLDWIENIVWTDSQQL